MSGWESFLIEWSLVVVALVYGVFIFGLGIVAGSWSESQRRDRLEREAWRGLVRRLRPGPSLWRDTESAK